MRHLLAHTAGMSGWTETMTFEDVVDWEKATTMLARQAPWFKQGTVAAYHPMTYGPLIGEVVRRMNNVLYIRNERGRIVRVSVDPAFRFEIDGKEMTVTDLQPGTQLTRTAFRVIESASFEAE